MPHEANKIAGGEKAEEGVMNSCPDIFTIQALTDGQLSPQETERLQEHLASCAACLQLWQELQRTHLPLAALSEAPPENLAERINQALQEIKPLRPISCRKAQRWISLALDKALSEAQEQRLQAHLWGCARCYRLAQEMQLIAGIMRATQAAPAPEGLLARLQAAVSAATETTLARKPHSKPRLGWSLAGAAAVAALFFVVFLFRPFSATSSFFSGLGGTKSGEEPKTAFLPQLASSQEGFLPASQPEPRAGRPASSSQAASSKKSFSGEANAGFPAAAPQFAAKQRQTKPDRQPQNIPHGHVKEIALVSKASPKEPRQTSRRSASQPPSALPEADVLGIFKTPRSALQAATEQPVPVSSSMMAAGTKANYDALPLPKAAQQSVMGLAVSNNVTGDKALSASLALLPEASASPSVIATKIPTEALKPTPQASTPLQEEHNKAIVIPPARISRFAVAEKEIYRAEEGLSARLAEARPLLQRDAREINYWRTPGYAIFR